jgi:hypothetical protein
MLGLVSAMQQYSESYTGNWIRSGRTRSEIVQLVCNAEAYAADQAADTKRVIAQYGIQERVHEDERRKQKGEGISLEERQDIPTRSRSHELENRKASRKCEQHS